MIPLPVNISGRYSLALILVTFTFIAFFGTDSLLNIVQNKYSYLSSSSSKTSGEAMSGSIYRAVMVTVPTLEVGKTIAKGLVANKLAACVNIIPQVTSIYEWQGKIEEDSELLLIIKTQASHFDQLTDFVKANHPAEVPEVISLPIDQGSKSYLEWISEVTKGAKF